MRLSSLYFFFFNDTATTEIYTLSLHDALPIWPARRYLCRTSRRRSRRRWWSRRRGGRGGSDLSGSARSCREAPRVESRSEEHTSELQSRQYLVCRLLLEKKKQNKYLMDSAR